MTITTVPTERREKTVADTQLPLTSSAAAAELGEPRKGARNMGLFGPSKVRITPEVFARAQLDYLFSAEFAGQQRGQFHDLSRTTSLLRGTNPEAYVTEKQNAVFNLLQI